MTTLASLSTIAMVSYRGMFKLQTFQLCNFSTFPQDLRKSRTIPCVSPICRRHSPLFRICEELTDTNESIL